MTGSRVTDPTEREKQKNIEEKDVDTAGIELELKQNILSEFTELAAKGFAIPAKYSNLLKEKDNDRKIKEMNIHEMENALNETKKALYEKYELEHEAYHEGR